MSLDQIQTVVAVAEEGSLRRAASRLHTTQPPLSRQISNLELELGVRLFERTSRGMHLSTSGQRFVVQAKQVLAAVEQARLAAVAPMSEGLNAAGVPNVHAGQRCAGSDL